MCTHCVRAGKRESLTNVNHNICIAHRRRIVRAVNLGSWSYKVDKMLRSEWVVDVSYSVFLSPLPFHKLNFHKIKQVYFEGLKVQVEISAIFKNKRCIINEK